MLYQQSHNPVASVTNLQPNTLPLLLFRHDYKHKCYTNRATILAVIHTRKTLCALRVYTQTVIGVFFVDANGNTHACLTLHDDAICFTWMDAIFKSL